MDKIRVIKTNYLYCLIVDLFFAVAVYSLPAISHLTVLPLQVLEPFRLMILISIVLMGSRSNALLLAVSLPLFSFFVVGHPAFVKALLISVELVANVMIYDAIKQRMNNNLFPILIAILLSKAIYYGFKFIIIRIGLLDMTVVSTSMVVQLIVACVTALCFSYLKTILVNRV